MAIYELRCAEGHVFEVIQSFTAPLPECPCGAATAKIPSSFGFAGRAAGPPPPERMPQTWRGTYNGNREYLTTLQHAAEQRRRFEQRHPEVAGDQRPIVAHEGRYEGAPLRRGDVVPPPGGAPSSAHGDNHTYTQAHRHDHAHGHDHGNGARQGHGDSRPQP